MAISDLEKRVESLESEVAALKRRLEQQSTPDPAWWNNLSYKPGDDAATEEAFRLGQEWRKRENAKSLRKKRKNARS